MTRRQISHHKKQERRQRLIFFGGIGIIAAVIILVIVGIIVGEIIPNNKTVLQVGDTKYNYSYYVDSLKVLSVFQSDYSPSEIVADVPQTIRQAQILREGAASLNITISDDEVETTIEGAGLDVNDATMDFIRAQLLIPKLQEYFGTQLPETMPQVDLDAIFTESETVAGQIRPEMAATDNISVLAEQYDLNPYSSNNGTYGWHPSSILETSVGSSIPVEWAFQASSGDVSQPLSDNESWKKKGYWLLRVNSVAEEVNTDNETMVSANVSGILLGNEEEALQIRDRLVAGEDLAAIAEQYSQYSSSSENGGELGVFVETSDNYTHALSALTDPYIFGEDTEIGAWSSPVMDDVYWTQGGFWLAKALGVDENRALSEDDRTTLINDKYNEWQSVLDDDPAYEMVNTVTDIQQADAVTEAEKYLTSLTKR